MDESTQGTAYQYWNRSPVVRENEMKRDAMKRERPLRPRPIPVRSARGGAWLCGALLSLAACSDVSETLSARAQVTDSAGVVIVTNPSDNAVHATIVPEPILSIGALDGPDEVLFGSIASVAIDDHGNLIVADGQTGEIRMFDPDGAYQWTAGGSGDGPGEFRRLAGAWPTEEGTIIAVDTRHDRVTHFGSSGELLTTETLGASRGQIRSIRFAGPGGMVSLVRYLPSPQSSRETGVENVGVQDLQALLSDPLGTKPEYVLRHGLTGAPVDTVASVPGQAMVVSAGGGTSLTLQMMRVPLAPSATFAVTPNGRIAVTTGRSYEISLYDPEGTLGRIARLAEEPPVITDAHLETWVRGSTGGREPMDDIQVADAVSRYKEMTLPERLPAWSSLVFTANGEIWARRFTNRGAETVRYDVFGADGGFLGQVTTSTNLRIQHIGEGRLTAASTDPLGVERVEVYELR